MKAANVSSKKKLLVMLLTIILSAGCLFLITGCSSGKLGNNGGTGRSIVQQGVYAECGGDSGGSSSGTSLGDAWTKPGGKEGTVVKVPSEYENNCMKFMGYDSEVKGA